LALQAAYVALGYPVLTSSGGFATSYVVTLSLADTVFVLGLVMLFLYSHGERPRDVLIGSRPVASEVPLGFALMFLALAAALAFGFAILKLAPSLHTVERNPLQDLLSSRRDALMFAGVVILAGGVREEVQRAFILHRFREWLGGPIVGLIVTSIAFGAGHLPQGLDAAVITGVLGCLWGAVYLRRGSIVAPVVSHAGFDLLEIVQFMVGRALQS
jgi:membrane protease YdiL (CAAX protease family)